MGIAKDAKKAAGYRRNEDFEVDARVDKGREDRNAQAEGKVKVVEDLEKELERKLQWFGYVKKRDEDCVGRKGNDYDLRGKRWGRSP